MIRLAAFADEISPDLDEQISVLREEGIGYVELRGVWNTNVLDLTDAQVAEVRRAFGAQSISVASIGSPIGKVPIDSPFDEHVHRFERALTLARAFGARYVRIFSFYPPTAGDRGPGIGDRGSARPEVRSPIPDPRSPGTASPTSPPGTPPASQGAPLK